MNQFPKGYQACGFHCGIKKAKDDLTVVVSDVPAAAAAVYTNNLFQAAPLVVTKAHLAQEGKAQAIVVNSGVANAAMGKQGIHDAEAVAKTLADIFALPEQYTIVASTGVIGMPLPVDKINAGIAKAKDALQPLAESAEAASRGIMTTDTVPKTASATITIEICRRCWALCSQTLPLTASCWRRRSRMRSATAST